VTLTWTVGALVVLAIAIVAVRYATAYTRLQGKRVLTCPETGQAVGVDLEVGKAALAEAVGVKPALSLADCTRWPERAGCDQACLHQMEAAPESCKLRTLLEDWYVGKRCAFCRKSFATINWTDHKPALLTPDLKTIAWSEVRPEMVDLVLGTHMPVCWDCHVAETFRREHPELITDRRFKKTDLMPPSHSHQH
jgi:hypothetical protein